MKRRRQIQFESERELEKIVNRAMWDALKVMLLFIAGWMAVGWIAYEAYMHNWL